MITDCKYQDELREVILAVKNGVTIFVPICLDDNGYKYIVDNHIPIADPD